MDTKIFIEKIKDLKFIAHRLGYAMTDYPENSIEVLETIFDNKKMLDACYGFEFDICFTKDNIPIVIHDKYIDDITDSVGLVKSYNLKDLKEMSFGFRKSLNTNNNYKFKIITLEEILTFFKNNIDKLDNKLIKIETKEAYKISKNNMKMLAKIINKFPNLNKNIIHLSFYPQNLIILKKIQRKNNYILVKNDLLCDYKIIASLAKSIKEINNISLRIKVKDLTKTNKTYTNRVNRKLFMDIFFMKFSNAINEKLMRKIIKKTGLVGVYVLNDENDIEEFCKNISEEFFKEHYQKFIFTSNNPIYLKSISKTVNK